MTGPELLANSTNSKNWLHMAHVLFLQTDLLKPIVAACKIICATFISIKQVFFFSDIFYRKVLLTDYSTAQAAHYMLITFKICLFEGI